LMGSIGSMPIPGADDRKGGTCLPRIGDRTVPD
jgi:hypothetical protein